MSPTPPTADLQGLRRRLVRLLVVQSVLAMAALACLIAALAFHQPWGLPAFALVLTIAVAGQLRFIWSAREGGGER